MLYLRSPATLRKARSLRSDASVIDTPSSARQQDHKAHTFMSSGPLDFENTTPSHFCSDDFDLSSSHVPSEPSSPAPLCTLPFQDVALTHLVPMCDEDAAERRLRLLLRKDSGLGRPDSPILGSFTASSTNDSDSEPCSQLSEADITSEADCVEYFGRGYDTDVKDDLRAKAIHWIVTVVPPVDDVSSKKTPVYSGDLYRVLMRHPDTRFLAAYFFGRFLLLVAKHDTPDAGLDPTAQAELDEGRRIIVWDFAVAAIALSVKLQCDTLPPFRPVFARDFMVLIPHDHEMNRHHLEAAQRDILAAFSYNLSTPTPQAYLDELYACLPTLRKLLSFDRGWSSVVDETWKLLLGAVCEPDVFRFAVSVLTATALEAAMTRVLRRRAAGETGCPSACTCRCHVARPCSTFESSSWSTVSANQEDVIGTTELMASLVMDDIRDVLGFSKSALATCRQWMSPVCSS
ncbi:hypothetical protein FA95DRAFT_1561773 [Auriscalpium vulgare]|uniref:Uncharacterized protein n=1 Tax=Auriscalpium vulgare TaxID=40419 RepID=A0ACB8RML6_9AGAM|nr:hypothetical protein FA95DRAFT_1561773 [Auriscalpium vulgare]